MRPELTIFLSGTRRDLEGFFPAAKAALEAAFPHAEVRLVEEALPDGSRGDLWSRREATTATVLVGLVGHFYGHVPDGQELSLTEQEFETAGRAGVDRLMFLTDASDPQKVADQDAVAKERVARFRARVNELFRGTAATPEEFARKAVDAVRDWERRTLCGATQGAREFYRRWLDPDAIIGHQEPLVGQQAVLGQLLEFTGSEARVLVLHAPWGRGKSRLLLEFAERSPVELRFARFEARLTRETLRLTPVDPCILVIEDAQSRRESELPALFEFLSRCDRSVKLVVATRTSHIPALAAALREGGIAAADVTTVELPRLTEEEHRALVVQELGHDGEDAARVAARTRGSPLAALVAARLLKRRLVQIHELEGSEGFEEEVLERYQQALMKGAGSPERERRLRRVLQAVALSGPIRPRDADELDLLTWFLGCSRVDLLEDLEFLEDSGLLLRLGGLVTIPVDAIRETTALRACVTRRGELTGEAERAFLQLHGRFRGNLLANLAVAEWRGREVGQDVRLLDRLLPELVAAYGAMPAGERLHLLEDMESVAPLRPAEALSFVRQALPSGLGPAGSGGASNGGIRLEWIYDRLTKMVRGALHEPRWVGEACDLLWLMAKDETRPLNSHPDAAERVLREVGRRDLYRADAWFEAFLLWAERHAARGSIPGDRLAAYVAPMLDKDIDHNWSDGVRFYLEHRLLNPAVGAPLRKRALDLLERFALAPDLVVAAAGIGGIGGGMAPARTRGQDPPPELLAAWEPEQVEAIDRLRRVRSHHDSRAVDLCIMRELAWSADHSKQPAVRTAAADLASEVRAAVMGTVELALAAPYGHVWGLRDALEEHRQEVERIATRLAGSGRSPDDLIGEIAQTQARLEAAGLKPLPGPLLRALSALQPEFAESLADQAAADPRHSLAGALDMAVAGALVADAARGSALLDRIVATGPTELQRVMAQGCRIPGWVKAAGAERSVAHLRGLLRHDDRQVRRAALQSAWLASELDARVRLTLLLDYDVAADPATGEEWAEAIMAGGLYPAALPEEQKRLARKLEASDELEFWGQSLVSRLSGSVPGEVVDMLIDRVRDAGRRLDGFDAVPRSGQDDYLASLPPNERDRGLIALGEHITSGDGWVQMAAWALFAQLSRGDAETSRRVRMAWAGTGEERLILAAALSFSNESKETLFTEEDTVLAILRAGEACGAEMSSSVQDALYCTTSTEMHWGTSEEVAVRDQAVSRAEKYPPGSVEAGFYARVAAGAQFRIDHVAQREAELPLRR